MPGGHPLHFPTLLSPVAEEYRPAGQSLHESDEDWVLWVEYFPGPHASQTELSLLL